MKIEIDSKEFYVVHEKLIDKFDNKENPLNKKKDYLFYGYDSGSGKSANGLSWRIFEALTLKNYHFKGFKRNANGEIIFSGEVLRKAKERYNNSIKSSESSSPKTEIEDMYFDAFLCALEISNDDLLIMAEKFNPMREIDHTQTMKQGSKKSGSAGQMPQPSRNRFILVKDHFKGSFCLYSYNAKFDKVYKAILKFNPSDTALNVILDNYPKAHSYEGILDFNLAHFGVVVINLKTKLKNKTLELLLNVDLNSKTNPSIYIGQMTKYGEGTQIITSDIFIERSEDDKPDAYDLSGKSGDKLPPHVVAFFNPPVFSETSNKQFAELSEFLDWIAKSKPASSK